MQKHPRSRYDNLLNKAHRYFVLASIGFTLVSSGYLGLTYYYFQKNKQIQRLKEATEQSAVGASGSGNEELLQ